MTIFGNMRRLSLVALFCTLLAACAGSGGPGSESSDNGMGDTPCEECGKQGDIELKITDEKFYREWNREAYSRLDSGAVVGVFPALKVVAKRPEICKMCHSFSADALDFDLAHIEDSLFVKAFPKMRRELMLPGMRLPDADSSYLDTLSVRLLKSDFADGLKLEDVGPWVERDGIEQAYAREAQELAERHREPLRIALPVDSRDARGGNAPQAGQERWLHVENRVEPVGCALRGTGVPCVFGIYRRDYEPHRSREGMVRPVCPAPLEDVQHRPECA